MKEITTKYINGFVMCFTCNFTNRKLGLYIPLPLPSHPWEGISMDFVGGGFPMSKRGCDYLYVVMDNSSKICILMLCKGRLFLRKLLTFSFIMCGSILDFPHPLSQIRILNSLGSFGQDFGE